MRRGLRPCGGMRTWAVTGPTGGGKSAVSAVLAGLGAAIVDGDRLGHRLLGRADIRQAVADRFGAGMVVAGAVDRARLGQVVFRDPAALQDLNRLMHGPLGELATEELAALARAGDHELAVFEAAVYFLLPSPPPVDLVVAVTAAADVRERRLRARSRGRLTAAEAAARIAAQAPLTGYWSAADEIIVNEGTLDELETRTRELWSRRGPGSKELP